MEREVTLAEVLAAREARVERQDRLRERHGSAGISFTLNIAGPVKDSPLIRRTFLAGQEQLETGLTAAKLPILECLEQKAVTGCEALYAVEGMPQEVKTLCVSIEDGSPLGRLFDMDVLDPTGRKLDRAEVNGGPRNCMVCGAPGNGCASRRIHSAAEVQAAARRLMEGYFAAADRETAEQAPEDTFRMLKPAGKAAERTMYAATGGVNTHKGAIFTLGLICSAAGRLWRADCPCRDPERILSECAAMAECAVSGEWDVLPPETTRTAGETLYLKYGLDGARGEVAQGVPGILQIALPILKRAAGRGRNDAGAIALVYLIARGRDTNMVSRGGADRAEAAAERCLRLLEWDPFPDLGMIAEIDRAFIRQNLSPGGCADLLAGALFLQSWESSKS